ncbi:hypothetical protein KP509_20G009100 [Ceratopteris richardii]|uniref:Myb/SANT-like DNA-binding domain-containing protein n=1 Tax=Ceratopteris richardii TaxID=49495 RepID=A0A8T2SEQ2_CERRI|nr:hypothetical protein KP509_20G009100 [Ceratopteris richardii]KAH7330941.1 hypothetical protein KP509_20G009100 [Ceratopteris richardii]
MAGDSDPQQDEACGTDSSASTSTPSQCPPPALHSSSSQQPPPPFLPVAVEAGAAPLPQPTHMSQVPPHVSQSRSLHAVNPDASPAPCSDRPFRDDWSENATFSLIQAWGERYLELNRGNLKQRHWMDVADSVNSRPLAASKPPKTDVQCKNRIDTLKKKYKIERTKVLSGGPPSRWAFFDRLDDLIGSSRKSKIPPAVKATGYASVAGDGHCVGELNGQFTPTSIAKCSKEEDVTPPMFFIPPQLPPLMPPHVGGMFLHMDPSMGNLFPGLPLFHHLTGDGAQFGHHAGMPMPYVQGNAGGNTGVNEQTCDAPGADAGGAAADTASKSKEEPDVPPSSPPHKRPSDQGRVKRKRDVQGPSNDASFGELARAICRFVDVYERVERAKLEQAMKIENQRRELVKDLEMKRMELFMKMQMKHAKSKNRSNKRNNAENSSGADA